jgi:hypothetical protein
VLVHEPRLSVDLDELAAAPASDVATDVRLVGVVSFAAIGLWTPKGKHGCPLLTHAGASLFSFAGLGNFPAFSTRTLVHFARDASSTSRERTPGTWNLPGTGKRFSGFGIVTGTPRQLYHRANAPEICCAQFCAHPRFSIVARHCSPHQLTP